MKSGSDDKRRPHVRLRICSPIICKDLEKYNIFPNKTGKELYPNIIPDEFFGDYLRGLFDADGCVNIDYANSIRTLIVSMSYKLLDTLRKKCNNIGTIQTKILKSGKNFYTWLISKNHSLYLRNIFYKNDCFALKRKKDKFYSASFNKPCPRYFTDQEIKFIIDNYQYLDTNKIAKKFNRSVHVIRQIAQKNRILKKKFWNEKDKIFLYENYTKYNIKYLANIFGRTPKSVKHQISKIRLLENKYVV